MLFLTRLIVRYQYILIELVRIIVVYGIRVPLTPRILLGGSARLDLSLIELLNDQPYRERERERELERERERVRIGIRWSEIVRVEVIIRVQIAVRIRIRVRIRMRINITHE